MENLNFFDDFRENLIDQYEKCNAYKVVCNSQNYNPKYQLLKEKDIDRVPFLVTTVFKKSNNLFSQLLKTAPSNLDKWTVSSSTSGDPSIVGRREEDIIELKELMVDSSDTLDLHAEYNCVFYPEPEVMKSYRSVNIMEKPTESYIGNILDLLPAGQNAIYLLKETEGEFTLDLEQFEHFVREHDGKNHHLFLRGSTILLYQAVQYLKDKINPVNLGEEAMVHTGGGGWDGKKGSISIGAKLERWQFVEEVSEFLGIPKKNFVDTYSFTENSFPITGHYSEKEKSYLFHVPKWGRVIIRDMKTLEPLKNVGDKGFVETLNAYGTSAFAGAAVLVDDLGQIVSMDRCPECGQEFMTIKILGRVKGSEAKGCGATLNVKGSKNEN